MPHNVSLDAVIQATALLSIKMWLCGTITTYLRGRVMESPNAEDGAVMNFFNRVFFVPTAPLRPLNGAERDAGVNRWVRVCNNDTANIPIGLFVLWLAASSAALPPQTLVALTWVFVGARFAHTLFYALSLQPFRTAAYALGSLCVLCAAGALLVAGVGS